MAAGGGRLARATEGGLKRQASPPQKAENSSRFFACGGLCLISVKSGSNTHSFATDLQLPLASLCHGSLKPSSKAGEGACACGGRFILPDHSVWRRGRHLSRSIEGRLIFSTPDGELLWFSNNLFFTAPKKRAKNFSGTCVTRTPAFASHLSFGEMRSTFSPSQKSYSRVGIK